MVLVLQSFHDSPEHLVLADHFPKRWLCDVVSAQLICEQSLEWQGAQGH